MSGIHARKSSDGEVMCMWQTYLQPTSLDEALGLLHDYGGTARIVSGGTDVLVELQRGVRPTKTLIDITAVPGLKYVREEGGVIRLGALATHNDVLASSVCARRALPLSQACWEVGAPQIRTRGTISGNLITASPANDTIAPLLALDAELVLASRDRERVVRLQDLYTGLRKTVLAPEELVSEIRVAAMAPNQRGIFLKLGLRQAQAISVINIAAVLTFSGDLVTDARVALGCVAPTVIRAVTVENYLVGKQLDSEVRKMAGKLAGSEAHPIGDVRGSASYRLAVLETLLTTALERLAKGAQADGWEERLERPIRLETPAPSLVHTPFAGTIRTTINGTPYTLSNASGKSLLNLLREDAYLTGTKEGCAEGECGACTVWLNGQAVMSCLVPAPQAHDAMVTTIEGLAAVARERSNPSGLAALSTTSNDLHPLQQAFIQCGAVQCGFCIPGMLMAGAKALEECPDPSDESIRIALSGNICRCTGYRKILDAVGRVGGQAS
jgi:xanthine dehydrogenase iron-sulfur cluster and FAD-binding subunit A